MDGGAFSPDECWDEYTGDTVRGKILWNEEGTVACEVVNDKGNVVYTQNFVLHVRPTFGYTVRNAFQDTYLYGVSEYTISHIRWRVYNCLDALGVEY